MRAIGISISKEQHFTSDGQTDCAEYHVEAECDIESLGCITLEHPEHLIALRNALDSYIADNGLQPEPAPEIQAP